MRNSPHLEYATTREHSCRHWKSTPDGFLCLASPCRFDASGRCGDDRQSAKFVLLVFFRQVQQSTYRNRAEEWQQSDTFSFLFVFGKRNWSVCTVDSDTDIVWRKKGGEVDSLTSRPELEVRGGRGGRRSRTRQSRFSTRSAYGSWKPFAMYEFRIFARDG